MGGRSRGISPIPNYGPSAIIVQHGMTTSGSEADRRPQSAPCTCARTNSISVRNPSGFDECWNALSDPCAGKRKRPTDPLPPARRLRARELAPDDSPAIVDCVVAAEEMETTGIIWRRSRRRRRRLPASDGARLADPIQTIARLRPNGASMTVGVRVLGAQGLNKPRAAVAPISIAIPPASSVTQI